MTQGITPEEARLALEQFAENKRITHERERATAEIVSTIDDLVERFGHLEVRLICDSLIYGRRGGPYDRRVTTL